MSGKRARWVRRQVRMVMRQNAQLRSDERLWRRLYRAAKAEWRRRRDETFIDRAVERVTLRAA